MDIGIMVYCIANKTSYSSSFNIFAVIAGVYSLKANLKARRLTSQFAALLFFAFPGLLLAVPFLLPYFAALCREPCPGFQGGRVVSPWSSLPRRIKRTRRVFTSANKLHFQRFFILPGVLSYGVFSEKW